MHAVFLLALFAAAPPGLPTSEQQALMAQAAMAWASAHASAAEDRLDSAIASMEKALTVARQATGEAHRDQRLALGWLAAWEQRRGNLAKAAAHRLHALQVSRVLFGKPSHDAAVDFWEWRTVELQVEMTPPQRTRLLQADRAFEQATTLYDSGHNREAFPLAKRAIDGRAALLGEGHPDTWNARSLLGLILLAQGRPREALPLLHGASSFMRAAMGEDHPRFAATLSNLGLTLQALGRHRDAIPLHRRALAIRSSVDGPNHPLVWQSLNNLAGAVLDAGGRKEALPIYRRALQVADASMGEKHPEYSNALNNLGLLLHEMSDQEAALPLLEKATRLARSRLGENHIHHAASLHNLALVHQAMGDYRKALELETRVSAIVRRVVGAKHPHHATCLATMARLHFTLGDYPKSLALINESADITRGALGAKHPDYAESLASVADIRHRLGDIEVALPIQSKAVEIIRASLGAKHHRYALHLFALGEMQFEGGHPDKALASMKEALALQKELVGESHVNYANVLNRIAQVMAEMGQRKAAMEHMRLALTIARKSYGEKANYTRSIMNNLANLYRDTGDHKRALALYAKRLPEGESRPGNEWIDAGVLSNIAQLRLDLGENAEARKLLDRSLTLAMGRLRETAVAQSERMQLAAADAVRFHLHLRLSVPPAVDDAGACHGHVLGWKGAVLLRQQRLRLFARLAADPKTRADAEALERATRQLATLAASPSAPFERLQGLTGLKEELQSRLAERAGNLEDRTPTSREIADALPKGTALVDYVFHLKKGLVKDGILARHQHRLCAFVLRPGKPAVRIDLCSAEDVKTAVSAWRAKLESSREAKAVKALVWGPLEKHLAGAKQILLSPDGVLGTLPFSALPGAKEGSYLLEDVALAVVPVPRSLLEMLDLGPLKGTPTLLSVGGLDYGEGGEWAGLPASRAEAKAIGRMYKKRFDDGKLTALSGEAAGKEAVCKALPGVRFCHLATHGFFKPRQSRRETLTPLETVLNWNPLLLSGIVLSGANQGNGLLTAMEVSEMDLSKLELAVLSACETGLGETADGEGLLGLQRAFQVAGCRAAVTSLWSVDDAATAVLMERFYHHLWEKKLPKIEALRQAQLDVMRHPEWVGEQLRKFVGVRGLRRSGRGIEREDADTRQKQRVSPPAWWAAWQLSGDWR